jgi:[FeFe] hydrogenase H-cluster maturation GTPase HydF
MAKGKDNKPHIGIFGRRNNGKSSFINTIVQQDIAIVSDHSGTTTDPVKKSIEIFGIGPAIIVDTAGIDDSGDLGNKRVKKSMDIIKTIDMAILMIAHNQFGSFERDLIAKFEDFDVPYFIVHNKSDLEKIDQTTLDKISSEVKADVLPFSTVNPDNLDELIDLMRKTIPQTAYQSPSLMGDMLKPGDYVLLITPIDSEVPDGRMILPQVMAIRDALDNDCICVVLKETDLEKFIKNTNIKPALAVTDSQAFEYVDKIIPEDIPLTGFSILFSRLRGAFDEFIEGTPKIAELQDGDRVLIMESCTHHVSCDDIGRHKLPGWINNFTEKEIKYDVVAGLNNLSRDIHDYKIVIQCGGCMITRKQILSRLKPAIEAGIPVSNYGMAIAFMHGIFDRAIAPYFDFE